MTGGVILDDTFNLFLRTTTKNQPPIVPQGGRDRPLVERPWPASASRYRKKPTWRGGAMARERRTVLGSLIDHDKARMYNRSKMLFTMRWLEQHPLVKWILETWATKPWRT